MNQEPTGAYFVCSDDKQPIKKVLFSLKAQCDSNHRTKKMGLLEYAKFEFVGISNHLGADGTTGYILEM